MLYRAKLQANTFLCFYRSKQDNGCEVKEASNQHAANVLKASCFVLACKRVRAFTLFPEILWKVKNIDVQRGYCLNTCPVI